MFAGVNQTRRYGFQCKSCGDSGRIGASGELNGNQAWCSYKRVYEYFDMNPDDAVPMADALTARLVEARRAYWAKHHDERKERRGEWWDWYNRYLACSDWRALRERVLQRDSHECRGCGEVADQVHHLTYDRVGYERLEDLVSVCTSCHDSVHR